MTATWLEWSRGAVRLGLSIILLGAASTLQAEPWEEVAALSSLPKLDRARVEKGEVVSGRASGMTFARGQSVESVFLVQAPLEKTFGTLRAWNGSRHSDLKVYLHDEIGGNPGPGAFASLAQAPGNSAVKALAGASGATLHLTTAEAAAYPSAGSLGGPQVAFWSDVLSKRAQAYLSGGLPAVPAYETGSAGKITAASEVAQLLRGAPKIAGNFKGVLGAAGINGRPSRPALYWELVNAEGKGVLNLGASTANNMGAKGAQVADVQVYASGNYYTLVVVHQLWPVQVNGKEATLVWRGDLISSPSLGALRGIEKNAAGAALAKEVAKLAGYFQRDAGR